MGKKLLVGNFGSRNVGDLLILLAALEEFGAENCVVMIEKSEEEFVRKFLGKNFEVMGRVAGGFLSGVREFMTVLPPSPLLSQEGGNNERFDFEEIVFVGGGLFAISFRACLVWGITFYFLRKKFPNIPIRLQFQGVDKKLGVFSRLIVRRVFNHEKVVEISVRDESSREALLGFGIEKDIEVRADRVVEFLSGPHPASPRGRGDTDSSGLNFFSQKNPPKSSFNKENLKNYVCVNLVREISDEDLGRLVRKIQENYGKNCGILFVNFEVGDEGNLPQPLFAKEGGLVEVFTPRNLGEFFGVLKNAKAMVGERFHALVVGKFFVEENGGDVFVVRDGYSEKVRNFCEKYEIQKFLG